VTECIYTSHSLAKELLSKPDGFIVAMNGEEECVIKNIKRARTHANLDDSSTYWILNLCECEEGNIKIGR